MINNSLLAKVLAIILILGLNYFLIEISLIPNKWVNILWGSIAILSVLVIFYLLYGFVVQLYFTMHKRYSKKITIVTTVLGNLVWIVTIGLIIFVLFIIFISSGIFQKEYVFQDKVFYLYGMNVKQYCAKIYVKRDYLPLREELIGICQKDDNLTLYKQRDIVYLKTELRGNVAIYDLNKLEGLYDGE